MISSFLILGADGLGMACTPVGNSSTAAAPGAAASGAATVAVLSTQHYSVLGTDHPFKLLKISRAGVRDTYVQYFPPLQTPGPLVVLTDPYDGIDWGDSTDAQWAAHAGASAGYTSNDVNSIGYTAGVSLPISYVLYSPLQQASNLAQIHLVNGLGVLIVYGRFYHGSTIQDLMDDMLSAYTMVSQLSEIDKNNIGTIGLSLGGFMAGHGAARASQLGLNLKAGALQCPALDFSQFLTFHMQTIPALGNAATTAAHASFIDPHLRRILPATQGLLPWQGGSYIPYSASYLPGRLAGHYVLFQDTWDTMTPWSISQSFVQLNPAIAEGFWYQHTTAPSFATLAPSHSPDPNSGLGLEQGSMMLFSQSFVTHQLLPAGSAKIFGYYGNNLTTFFTKVRALEQAGVDISWLTPRLIELTDSNTQMVDVSNGSKVTMADVYVSGVVNTYWGANTTATSVKAYLQMHGL